VPEYCEAPEGAPRSLVIKIAAGSEDMRALMAPGFAWEIGFYQQLAHRLAIPPRTAGTRPSAPTSAATHW